MRIFLLISFVLLARICPAQKTDTVNKYLDKNFAFTSKSGKIYSAIAFPVNDHWVLRSFYADQSPLIEVSFTDKNLTVKDGPFVAYYPGKVRALMGSYQNNQRFGVWQSWHKNSQLKDSGFIKNNVLTGTWITWHENGTLMTRAHFIEKDGSGNVSPTYEGDKNSLLTFPPTVAIKNGVFQTWTANGLPKDSGNYENDLKVGHWRLGYDNGKTESEGSYATNESYDGDWIFYREDGTISTKEKYKDKKLADLKCFDEKGNLSGDFCSIAKPPVLLGTPYDWKMFFDTHLEWSKESMRNSREGIITIRFSIGKDGKLTNHTLMNSPSTQVSADIEKVINLMNDWSPAVLHNRPFEYSFDYQVGFYPQ